MANPPVPAPRTWTTGEVGTGAYENSLRDALNFLINPPIAVVYDTASQLVGNATFTQLICDSTAWDTYGGHSNSVNNSRYTAQVAGFYMVFGNVAFGPNATGNRAISLYKNGSPLTNPNYETLVPAVNTLNGIQIGVSGEVQLNVGDYIECWILQSSGGSLSLAAGASGFSVMWIHA